jgi:hypothetical protein
VLRLSRSALAIVAIVGLVAAGCGGSSGTPGPTAPPPISDPKEIVVKSIESLMDTGTLHLRGTVTGTLDLSSLGESGSGFGGKIDLAGTYVEGDVDMKAEAIDVKVGVPALLGLSMHMIAVDGYSYTQISLQGDKFAKQKSDESDTPLTKEDIAKQLEDFKKQIDESGAEFSLKGDGKVDGKDCYHVAITIPAEKLSDIAGEAGEAIPSVDMQDVTVDYYVYKQNLRPARLSGSGDAGAAGNLTFELTITDYDKAVNIKAPDDSQIEESPEI